jgi:hypothetical protein
MSCKKAQEVLAIRQEHLHEVTMKVLRRLVKRGIVERFRFTGNNSMEDRRGIDLVVSTEEGLSESEINRKNSFCYQQKTGDHYTKKVLYHFKHYKWPLYILKVGDSGLNIEAVFLLLFLVSGCVVPEKIKFAKNRLKKLYYQGYMLPNRVWLGIKKPVEPKDVICCPRVIGRKIFFK